MKLWHISKPECYGSGTGSKTEKYANDFDFKVNLNTILGYVQKVAGF